MQFCINETEYGTSKLGSCTGFELASHQKTRFSGLVVKTTECRGHGFESRLRSLNYFFPVFFSFSRRNDDQMTVPFRM